ncbi:MAG TPA: hypothetical protein VE152_01320 [Acidimicrobiales bacterium]|nr:hypothetical protein [Acidimicrobiales bacterium]
MPDAEARSVGEAEAIGDGALPVAAAAGRAVPEVSEAVMDLSDQLEDRPR